jgi:hypothetical protein
MLKVNGIIKDILYEDKLIDPKMLADLFDLPVVEPFALIATDIQYDRFGQAKVPRSMWRPAQISVNSPFGNFSLRYFDRETRTDKGFQYIPAHVMITGQPMFDDKNYDLFVFMCLSGLVLNVKHIDTSGSIRPYLSVLYPERINKANEDRNDLIQKLMSQLFTDSDSIIAIKARGMGMSGTVPSLRTALMQRATNAPEALDSVYNSGQITDKGKILTAIDKGIIEQLSKQSQLFWAYTSVTSRAGQLICQINQSKAPDEVLFDYLSDPAARSEFLAYIKPYIQPQEVTPPVVVTKEELTVAPAGGETKFSEKIVGEIYVSEGWACVFKNEKEYQVVEIQPGQTAHDAIDAFVAVSNSNRMKYIHLTKQ